MKCPKCGYERQSRDDAIVPPTECPACNVVYAKHTLSTEAQHTGSGATPAHLKPSPVDPQSLRKARERVDQRLRKKLKERTRDERHARTLRLAKQMVSEQVRLRREAWQEKLNKSQIPAQDEQPASADSIAIEADKKNLPSSEMLDAQRQTPDTVETRREDTHSTAQAPQMDTPPPVAPDDAQALPFDETTAAPAPLLKHAAKENRGHETIVPGNRQTPSESAPLSWETPDEKDFHVPSPHEAAMALKQRKITGHSWLSRLMPLVAWLILIAGVIGAVLSWITITDVQAGVRFQAPDDLGSLPIGLLLGFAYLATGILGFAFFWVSSLICVQLKDIRQMLLFPAPATTDPSAPEEGGDLE